MTALLSALLLVAVVVIALLVAALRRSREDARYWREHAGRVTDARRQEQALREKARMLRQLKEAAR